jgi:hypothetical protein
LSSLLGLMEYLSLLEIAEVLDVYEIAMDLCTHQVVQHFEGYVLILLGFALSCDLFHSKEAFQSFLVFHFLRVATIGPLPGRSRSSTS